MIGEKYFCRKDFTRDFERDFCMKIIVTIIPTTLVINSILSLFYPYAKPNARIKFSASW